MLKKIWKDKSIVKEISRQDFKGRFAGTNLGFFWAFIQPIIIVSIYWLIFEVGLKAGPGGDAPFLLWLLAGICPWFYLNDMMNTTANSLIEYSYVIKKVKFNIWYIPLVKIISSTKIHLFLAGVTIVVFMLQHYTLSIFIFQIVYYTFCTFMLGIGLSYFNAAITVFFRDMAQIVNIIMQYSMWTVPIMISKDNFPKVLQPLLRYNPIYYIVQGYRDSFIYKIWFWQRPWITIYYWVVVMILFLLGMSCYKKLKTSFADVL